MSRSTAAAISGKRLTSEQRRQLLARYHRSSLSQADFAAGHGLGLSTLGKWLREERCAKPTSPAVSFQELVLPGAGSGWAVEVVSPQGWTLRLRVVSDLHALAPLLQALPC
jgi:hypothetical protein